MTLEQGRDDLRSRRLLVLRHSELEGGRVSVRSANHSSDLPWVQRPLSYDRVLFAVSSVSRDSVLYLYA